MAESRTFIVKVEGYPDGDDRERSELGQTLYDELCRVADDVRHREASAPAGTKGNAVEWATLAVQFAGTAPVLIGAINAWRGRNRGASVTVSIDGDSITLEGATGAERARLLDTWLQRHSEAGDT